LRTHLDLFIKIFAHKETLKTFPFKARQSKYGM
jgi:hypothetical protein